MIMFPLFIPTNSEESKCPKCNKAEDIINTCNHCGYKYEEEYEPMPLVIKIGYPLIGLVVFFIIASMCIPELCISECESLDYAFIFVLSAIGGLLWPIVVVILIGMQVLKLLG